MEYMNNTFDLSNYAPYGKEVGGYPVGVRVVSYNKLQLSSGQPYNGKIIVEVVDADNKRIVIDNQT
jgi:hypothetical protein